LAAKKTENFERSQTIWNKKYGHILWN